MEKEIFRGCSVGDFIKLLSSLPQDAIITSGNTNCYSESFESIDNVVANIFIDQISYDVISESDKQVIFWGDE